jgi:nucleoside-triphosphatase THEP1
MVPVRNRLILWTGPKHGGKTTSANHLVQTIRTEGFVITGILQPSIYDNDELIGFDVLDIQNQKRMPLARGKKKSKNTKGSFNFLKDGLEFGNAVLSSEATKSADLVIIDEFGPLELEGKGWRRNINSLLSCSNAIILIIIRQGLKEAFQQLYSDFACLELEALKEKSACEVIALLENRRKSVSKE